MNVQTIYKQCANHLKSMCKPLAGGLSTGKNVKKQKLGLLQQCANHCKNLKPASTVRCANHEKFNYRLGTKQQQLHGYPCVQIEVVVKNPQVPV